MQIARAVFFITVGLLTIFSYGFVDFGLPISVPYDFNRIVYDERLGGTSMYIFLVVLLLGAYAYFLRQAYKKEVTLQEAKKTILITSALLFLSFPAFSHDIFNYIATAKVTYFYGENPYIVMPIELTNEPMLAYLHAANKTALYGPSWILLTAIPHVAGMGNLLLTMAMFKALITLFYLMTAYLIWRISNKNILSLTVFALNPLILMESLVSSHNDIVMMFFALLSFYLLKKRLAILAFVSLLISIGIKFATVALVPVLIYVWYQQRQGRKIPWPHIWLSSVLVMMIVFLVSPVREEMYPWYFQWVIVFVALIPQYMWLLAGMIGLSLGLSLRFAPYVYVRNWAGPAMYLKPVITATSFVLWIFGYFVYRLFHRVKNK